MARPPRPIRTPILATAAVIALATAALLGSGPALIAGLLIGGLLLIWGSALELRGRISALHASAAERGPIAESLARAHGEVRSLQSLLNALGEPVLATDPAGRLTTFNAAAAGLLGLAPERLAGRTIEEVFTQEEVLRLHAQASAGAAVSAEVRIARPGGVRIWEIGAAPWSGGVVLSLRDVTDQARAMQVRTDFAANASHELRTPVAAMRIAMDTLLGLDQNDDPAVRERFLSMLARNIERLEAMVRDLLDISRLESPDVAPRLQPVPLADIVADLNPLYERTLRQRNLTLTFSFPGLSELHTDRNLLLLILGNLIDNATRFAFEGSEIRVAATRSSAGVRLEVADRGIGIPLDQQQRIFERYYQVDPARSVGSPDRGTGLGLSIVKHAVRRLGGSIRVESVWQQGTRMIVDLPQVSAPPNLTI
jgi:PAS domain S-box-containing protein